MTQTICRMYSSPATAAEAAETLLRHRSLAEGVRVVSPPQNYVAIDAIIQAIQNCGIIRTHAKIYAERVYDGCALLVCHAPLGTAYAVISCLDKYQPIDSGVPDATFEGFIWDEAAPFSSAFRMATKWDNATPFSTFWNLPVLAKVRNENSDLLKTIRFFSDRPAMLSGMFGVPVLTRASNVFSDFFGAPLSSNEPAPLSKLLKIPTRLNR